MSAYICDKHHFIYLTKAADRLGYHRHCSFSYYHDNATHYLRASDYETQAEAATMLLMENISSVGYRYNQSSSAGLPGPHAIDIITARDITRTSWRSFDPVQVIKACDCYSYQACEHPGWKTSRAKAFIDSLRKTAAHALPSYDASTWGAPEPISAVPAHQ
jgi:hypothetical protein